MRASRASAGIARFAVRRANPAAWPGHQSPARYASGCGPDSVLVDVRLPDGDGIALASDLRSLPWCPSIVLTSTESAVATDDDVRVSGAVAFVPKDDLSNAGLERLLAPL